MLRGLSPSLILLLVFGEVRVNDVGRVVDDRAVLLLRHSPVVRAHTALDVDDRDVELSGGDAAHHRVGVAQEDHDVGPHVGKHR
jgi:hypothetical protein